MKLLLTTKEAAEAIGMSESYVKKALRTKELPKVKHGRATRIDINDLREWNESRKIVVTATDLGGVPAVKSLIQALEKTVSVRP